MTNVKIDFEGVFALIEVDGILVTKVDLATISLVAVTPVDPMPPLNMPFPKSRELVIVANGVTIPLRIRDEEKPDTYYSHSAYALLKELHENMP